MSRRTLRLEVKDEDASLRFGEDLALSLVKGDVVALDGDLGSGKTTIARSVIRTLADDTELEVPSPTFTLVQAYGGRLPLQHFDLYRLSSPSEMEELGFADAVRDGAVLIEWPGRADGMLPDDTISIAIEESGPGRALSISGTDDFMDRLERSLAIRAFLDRSGMAAGRRSFLVGDASTRTYEMVRAPGRDPVILMNAPRRANGPPIRDGLPYSQIAHLAESVTPFVAIGRTLKAEGFAAPAIPAADLDAGLLLVEHLGDTGVLDEAGAPIAERYIAAAALLAEMHSRSWPETIEMEEGARHRIPPYDRGAMTIETELLIDWYLPHIAGRQASAEERAAYGKAWQETFAKLDGAERSLVLRDYHSPNIIWRSDRKGYDRIGLIDFQDALLGPSAYDVASLAMDARVTISAELERQIVEAYCIARAAQDGFDRDAFEEAYAIMAAQRNSKILGIFVRLKLRDGKAGYVRHLPRIREYVRRALAHPSLKAVAAFYGKAELLKEPDAA